MLKRYPLYMATLLATDATVARPWSFKAPTPAYTVIGLPGLFTEEQLVGVLGNNAEVGVHSFRDGPKTIKLSNRQLLSFTGCYK